VDVPGEALVGVRLDGAGLATEADVELEIIFRSQYKRVARIIARVIKDPARAEELAVDVFVKWSRRPVASGPQAEAWLYRTAVRLGLDELRRHTRRSWYEGLAAIVPGARSAATPEDIRASSEEQDRVRRTLGAMPSRQAALLVLRSDDFSYAELAATLKLNPNSIGTLLSRAQQAFRKEYIRRYGEP